jgi:capsular exopolysaccharide synthesis family protein
MNPNKKNNKKILANTKRKLIASLSPKSPISEQYRTIRTNISFSTIDEEIKTLMITSSGPGEGKSTTAGNLAVVYAQQGKSVLLVDADLRKPTVHYTFGLTNTFGLTSVLTRQSTIEESVKPSDVNYLDILTSGPIPPNPAELISSKGMKRFMNEVSEKYDMVIFDTPPVNAVTDAQLLANQCHGTVLVVSSGKTEKDSAIKAKELLDSAQAKLLGIVLNNRKLKESSYYYYYGHN